MLAEAGLLIGCSGFLRPLKRICESVFFVFKIGLKKQNILYMKNNTKKLAALTILAATAANSMAGSWDISTEFVPTVTAGGKLSTAIGPVKPFLRAGASLSPRVTYGGSYISERFEVSSWLPTPSAKVNLGFGTDIRINRHLSLTAGLDNWFGNNYRRTAFNAGLIVNVPVSRMSNLSLYAGGFMSNSLISGGVNSFSENGGPPVVGPLSVSSFPRNGAEIALTKQFNLSPTLSLDASVGYSHSFIPSTGQDRGPTGALTAGVTIHKRLPFPNIGLNMPSMDWGQGSTPPPRRQRPQRLRDDRFRDFCSPGQMQNRRVRPPSGFNHPSGR